MKKGVWILLVASLLSMNINAHEMTPTYPKLQLSINDNILYTTMTIFNRRRDVLYYEIGVFDKDFNPIDFVANEKIFQVPYLTRKLVNVYIRSSDRKKATYICSTSKIEKKSNTASIVYSKICSKLKWD
jgi:hypothetical protein